MIVTVCDYCGSPIVDPDDLSVTVYLKGTGPSDVPDAAEPLSGWIGHYHTAPDATGALSCWQKVREAMLLAESVGGVAAGGRR